MNVYDWLNNLPIHDGAKPFTIMEVSFNKGSRKEFFRNGTQHIFEKGDWLAVEGVGGFDVGQVSLTGELVKLQMKKYGVTENAVTKRVLHPATDEELLFCQKQKDREPEILIRSRAIARSLNLDMKLCEVEVQADSKKATFFYTADQRVDFRELIKLYAGDFKLKVEMRQIGARQESAKVGGIGSCGRELCCSTWLTDFKTVNTTAARYQNLSINQTKLSGQCGRLKCCLNYELDTYMDALSVFPDHAESLETTKGIAHLQKRDIFKNLMWYSYSDNNKQYPLSIVRVKEILKMNKAGQKADELQPVELETRESKSGMLPDAGFVNDVGQLSLKSLEKNNKKKKQGAKGGNPNATSGAKPAAGGAQPQQQRKQGGPQSGGGTPGNQQPKQGQPKQGQPKPQGPRPAVQGQEGQPAPQQNRPKPQHGPRPQQVGQAQEGQPGQDSDKPRQPQQQGAARPQGGPNNRPPRPQGDQAQRNQQRPRPEQRDRSRRPQPGGNEGGAEKSTPTTPPPQE